MMKTAVCIPRYAPGFDFWESEQDAEDMCNIGSVVCKVTYEYKIFDPTWQRGQAAWECVDNCECEEEGWLESANLICASLGDCGSSVNYINEKGYYDKTELRIITSKLREEKAEEVLAQG
jgi:hypothetical protein